MNLETTDPRTPSLRLVHGAYGQRAAAPHPHGLPEVPPSAPRRAGARVTAHAWQRMSARGVSPAAIDAALAWGRLGHEAGHATSHFLGRREVERAARLGVNIRHLEGLVVLLAADGATILTTFRNRERRHRRR
jgi:hypothetical protein